ncbi:MAG: hypothetical protein K1X64_06785 [Myxococcaceae bacterium]|nr:hypothetical protein [Myxococcaceae bacterium]
MNRLTVVAQVIAGAISVVALSMIACSKNGVEPRPGIELGFDDPRTAVWREAVVHASHRGAELLPEMELRASKGDEETRRRVKAWLEMALRRSLKWGDVSGYRALAKLGEAEVNEGRARFAELASAKVVNDHPPAGLHELGGFALAAATEALAGGNPVAQAEALRLIHWRAARHLRPLVEQKRADMTRLTEWHGDYSTGATLSNHAAAVLAGWDRQIDAVPCLLFEEDVDDFGSDLVNAMRSSNDAIRATTEQEYWDRARPAWGRWWGLTPDGGLSPPSREVWLTGERAQGGF